MSKSKFLLSFIVLFISTLFFTPKAQASTLASVTDTISTSRPSASAVITADQTASASQVTVTDLSDNQIFLASDSATLRMDTGETENIVTVASASAADTPSSNQRIVYFVGTAANTHHAGDPIVVPITALHVVQFTVPNAVPNSGKILLTFPALSANDANVAASPSASTFQMNGLADAGIEVWDDGGEISPTVAVSNPSAGTSPTVTLTLGAQIAANSVVKIYLGCTASTSAACTTPAPQIINPTKSAAAGTADTWMLTIETKDSSDIVIDSSKIRIGTIDSVLVQATVDPTLTVVIAGLASGADFNSSSGSCISETTNSGIAATATVVNLGVLGSGNINKAGQTITVSTNASNGYTITATSSGRLINRETGFWIKDANGGDGLTANDTPVPAIFPASGNPAFGISPCGARVPAAWTGGSAFAFGSGAKAANPWNSGANTYYATVASFTGPVSSDVTVLRYAATISGTTPTGVYTTVFTYVVTPTF